MKRDNGSTVGLRGTISSANRKRDHKNLVIEYGSSGEKARRTVPPLALVGRGDVVIIPGARPQALEVEVEGGVRLPVLPGYFARGVSRVGDIEYTYTISELIGASDIDDYEYLERFHYRTSLEALASVDSAGTKGVGGRKAVLLLKLRRNNMEQAAGYIELHMPLLMMKPRHALFATPFSHPTQPIHWEKWGAKEMAAHVNRICRVARVVVSPEYRGLGLAKLLIKSAAEFARTRWQVGGKRALFLEISAEMLNHIDFVSSSGFEYIGSTEGNVGRITKDLRAMHSGQKVNFGVMSLQNKYYASFMEAATRSGVGFDEFILTLETALQKGGVSTFRASDWYHFRSVLRFPQKYYLMGLDEYAHRYIVDNRPMSSETKSENSRRLSHSLRVRGLTVTSSYAPPNTEAVRAILDCFGMASQELTRAIIRPFDLSVNPGSIVLVAGASGSGKSVLLRALDPDFVDANLTRSFSQGARLPPAGWLSEISMDKPVVEVFAERYGMDSTVSTFHKVGLSEAFVFIKPYNLLSRGQRYRVRLAELILRDDPVWILDEFCADLDPVSAAVVSHNFRRIVLRQGRIAVVAAANHEHFMGALKPNAVLFLRNSGRVEQLTYASYRTMLNKGGAE